jgi:hypothetical protein
VFSSTVGIACYSVGNKKCDFIVKCSILVLFEICLDLQSGHHSAAKYNPTTLELLDSNAGLSDGNLEERDMTAVNSVDRTRRDRIAAVLIQTTSLFVIRGITTINYYYRCSLSSTLCNE